MAGISTYRFLAETIVNQHYGAFPMQGTNISLRHVAELIAGKVAKYAKISAFGNSNAGETTYSNDQFISTFYNQPLLTDVTTNAKYIVMPATPAGLPNNQEIVQVSFVGCPSCHIVPMKSKDSFVESILDPLPFSMYSIENGNIVFYNLPKLVTNSNAPVNIKMIGAVPGDSLLDSNLNIPKDIEDAIRVEILNDLTILYKVPEEKINTVNN